MSSASEALAARLRPYLEAVGASETRIVGGVGFVLNGNLVVGTTSRGEMLVRIDPDKTDDALARGARLKHMGAHLMTGFVSVDADTLDEVGLAEWVDYATQFVRTLPHR